MTKQVKTQYPIIITERAAKWIQSQVNGGMRVSTKTSGCTGYQYVLDSADTPHETDIIIEEHGVRVFIAQDSIPLLAGSTLDLVTSGLNSTLQFHNPNITAQCGCGESFTVDP